jgi:hypothetical protein
MNITPKKYLAYLLRLWQVDGNGDPAWRASLEDSRTGERRGFAGLESLVAYLREQLRGDPKDTNTNALTGNEDDPR